VLGGEHALLPRAVRWFCTGRLVIDGRRVHVSDEGAPDRGTLSSPGA
jgi:hypothetical protein